VSDKTGIEWTDATKRCSTCREAKAVTEFARDNSRTDGLTYRCRPCRNASARSGYTPKPRPAVGRRYVPARDGDQQQARRRIDHLINVGLLPDPNDVPCVDCEHLWSEGERRHEYDHHRGYAAGHHEDVEAVCTTCHHARENERRAA
jgi:hypothetical protein